MRKSVLLIFAGLALCGSMLRAGAADVTIDARAVYQRIDGFGASQRVFDDPHVFENFNAATARAATVLTAAQQDAVLDRLYKDLQLTRLRPASPETAAGAGIEPQNDNADPNVIDPSRFSFAWKNLDAHADFISRTRTRGVSTWFLSPLSRNDSGEGKGTVWSDCI